VGSRTSLDILEKRKINLFPLLEFEPLDCPADIYPDYTTLASISPASPNFKIQIQITFYNLLAELQNNFFRMPSNAD
jgi:hypothetical protein